MIFNTPIQLVNAYSNGFIGSVCDERGREKLLSESKHPYFGSAAQAIAGSGKGKVALAFKSLLRFDIRSFNERQVTGDCKNGSASVRMADGSIKQIKDIKIGEYVISGYGHKRLVTNVFKKPYNKKMVKVFVDGYSFPTIATPDHLYLTYKNQDAINNEQAEWKPIGELTKDDFLILPKCVDENEIITHKFDMSDFCDEIECIYDTNVYSRQNRIVSPPKGMIKLKGGRNPVKRFVVLDDRLAWVLGLYAAEGGVDGVNGNERITFNLGHTEGHYAQLIKEHILDIFGVDTEIYQVPSKPTVLYARIHSKIIANFFKYLIKGNTYTKSLSKEFFTSSKSVRLSLLHGWIDGDGHENKDRLSATTVSKSLIEDMFSIANSCGLRATIGIRPEYESDDVFHKESYNLSIGVSSGIDIIPNIRIKNKIYTKHKLLTSLGQAAKVKSVELCEPEEAYVYCIEVDVDHSFISEGYICHNCVSHATRNAVDITRACQIMAGSPESFMVRSATEGIYGFRGHGGQGMTCERAVRFVTTDGGILLRKKYDKHDLSNYNGRLGAAWGRSGVPKDLIILAKQNQVQTASNIKSVEEARDAIYNGYGVFFCSGLGFSSTRDNNGIAKRSGSWAHAMCYSSDTEILTTRGWVFVSDMKNSDVFYTLNPSTHEIELQSPTDILEFDYNGEMYYFNRRSLDILVTPEHRLYGIKGSRYIENNNPDNYEFIEAEDYSESFKVKLTGNNINNQHILKYKFKNYEINMDVWLEFLGYFISEGCSISFDSERIRADRKNNPYIRKVRRIEISQTKLENLDKIENCLAQLPFNFRRIQNKWVCENSDLNEELMILGKAWEKYIPEYVWDCGIDQLKILANALMLGDGHTDDGEYISYTTTSKKLADDFQRLMLMIGFSANVTKKQPHEKSFGIRDIFSINIRLYHTHVSLGKASKIEYSGKVYCPSTPNGVVYVRRNGKPSWCGNCFIAMDDTRELFDETLFLIQNSWGIWNNGPKRLGQPDGSFWVRQSVAESIIAVGSTWALSNVDGFPAQKINWSFDEVF